ncbi:MAG: hypothetical protein NT022_11400 [Deltaproteobacteria bacterium]|nr:hypothetical protein [Deltaproteobacteria bacterium]
MRMKHVENRNRFSCFLACIESFMGSKGVTCTQEEIIRRYPDLCKVVLDGNGKVLHGVVPHGQESALCARLGLHYDEVAKSSSVEGICPSLEEEKNYIIGITRTPDQMGNPRMHSVLYDSFDESQGILVMDPDQGHKALGKDYSDIVEIKIFEIS